MHNFMCQNVKIFPLYISLTKRISTFSSGGVETFSSGGIEIFWV